MSFDKNYLGHSFVKKSKDELDYSNQWCICENCNINIYYDGDEYIFII